MNKRFKSDLENIQAEFDSAEPSELAAVIEEKKEYLEGLKGIKKTGYAEKGLGEFIKALAKEVKQAEKQLNNSSKAIKDNDKLLDKIAKSIESCQKSISGTKHHSAKLIKKTQKATHGFDKQLREIGKNDPSKFDKVNSLIHKNNSLIKSTNGAIKQKVARQKSRVDKRSEFQVEVGRPMPRR